MAINLQIDEALIEEALATGNNKLNVKWLNRLCVNMCNVASNK
ncbi:hypothetical protein [Tolypothrix sp. NIES-4075]